MEYKHREKGQSDESDDDKKAETDDDSDLEKTATHQDSVDSYTDDEPEEKEPKEKKAPTIRTQVRRRSSKKVTDIVAGFPGENSRENANVKIYDKKTFFKASPVEQTKTDKRKKQQRFNYKICIHGQFSVRKNQNNQTPDESSINSSKLASDNRFVSRF